MQPLRAGLLGVGVALLLSGCASDVPSATVRGFQAVEEGAPSVVGNGGFALTIRLVSEDVGGPPIIDAPVLVFPIEKPFAAPSINQLRTANATWAARTDGAGEVKAWLDEGRTYTFLATAPGHTVEARHLIKLDNERRERPLDFVLFRESLTLRFEGNLPATTKISRIGPYQVSPAEVFWRPIEFHPSQQAQYVYRLAGIDARLKWTNTPDEFADLTLRAGFSPTLYWESDTSTEVPAQGPMDETLALSHADLEQGRPAKRFFLGPATGFPIVTADGLPYVIELDARFSTDPVPEGTGKTPRRTPGLGAVTVLVALAAILFVLHRRDD